MSAAFTRVVGGFGAALLFGVGLVLSGMTDPARVLGFLNVSRAWDPSLVFVMTGAVGVYAFAFRYLRKRKRSLSGDSLAIPTRSDIDAKLIAGAAIFGVGWGLSGYCPGPVVVSLGGGSLGVSVFVLALLLGMFAAARAEAAFDAAQRSAKARSTV